MSRPPRDGMQNGRAHTLLTSAARPSLTQAATRDRCHRRRRWPAMPGPAGRPASRTRRSKSSDKPQTRPSSEPTDADEVRRPQWKRLLQAASHSLAKKVEEGSTSNFGLLDDSPFVHPDAVGGGNEVDIYQCLYLLIEGMHELTDLEIGAVLVGTYHYINTDELPMSPQTWRVLALCSLRASVRAIITDHEKRNSIEETLLKSVSHWCPAHVANQALRAFKQTQAFKNRKLTPEKQARCYFALQDSGARISANWGSSSCGSRPLSSQCQQNGGTPSTSIYETLTSRTTASEAATAATLSETLNTVRNKISL